MSENNRAMRQRLADLAAMQAQLRDTEHARAEKWKKLAEKSQVEYGQANKRAAEAERELNRLREAVRAANEFLVELNDGATDLVDMFGVEDSKELDIVTGYIISRIRAILGNEAGAKEKRE